MEGIELHPWEETFKLAERFHTVSLLLERHLEHGAVSMLLSAVKRRRLPI